MALFCAAIRRDSVYILRFPFLSHVQVFSCEILFVCRLKCPYNCFSYHFFFLVIVILLIIMLPELFLVSVISLCAFLCILHILGIIVIIIINNELFL